MREVYTQRRSRCLHSECFMQMYDNEVHVYVMQVRELTQFEQAVSTALFEDVSAFSHHVRHAAEPSIGACSQTRVCGRRAQCDTRSSRASDTRRKIERCRVLANAGTDVRSLAYTHRAYAISDHDEAGAKEASTRGSGKKSHSGAQVCPAPHAPHAPQPVLM